MAVPVLPKRNKSSAHKAELLLHEALQLQAAHMSGKTEVTKKSQSKLIRLMREAHDFVKELV